MKQVDYSECLPAYGQDIFSYLAADSASNHLLHMILSFDNVLSEDLLHKAIRITMDIEPVLGCNFVEHPKAAYFKRRTDLDSIDYCPVCITEDPDYELHRFIALTIDSQTDPLVRAQIFRTAGKDILCVKLDHTISDGCGLKEYIYLLAKVYSHLCTNVAYPILEPPSRRDAAHILQSFSITDPLKAWQPSRTPPQPAWTFPVLQNEHQQPAFSRRQLNKEEFLALKVFAKKHNITINDILLAAYYRTLFNITNTPAKETQPISVSVDFRRRYAGDKIIIANVGSSFNVLLENNPQESFINTIKRVARMTAELKQNSAIMPNALFFEFLGSLPFSDAKNLYGNISQQNRNINTFPPFLSNVGVINPIKFGEDTALEGYIVTPAMFAPLFMLGCSTYNNVLTIVVNYYTSDSNSELIQTFLNAMVMDFKNLIANTVGL